MLPSLGPIFRKMKIVKDVTAKFTSERIGPFSSTQPHLPFAASQPAPVPTAVGASGSSSSRRKASRIFELGRVDQRRRASSEAGRRDGSRLRSAAHNYRARGRGWAFLQNDSIEIGSDGRQVTNQMVGGKAGRSDVSAPCYMCMPRCLSMHA
jgi:hypothetical protein